MFRRMAPFIMVNLLVMSTVIFILNIFNVQPYLTEQGLNIQALAIFCLLWGMTGAFISLLLSKKMALWFMKVKVIKDTSHPLVQKVYSLADRTGLPKMPEVGIFDSDAPNAFATGPSKKNSLVAVSSGLLRSMNDEEIEGVLAHEVSHIANGDMVTMTLLQGIVNAFVMFLARIAAYIVTNALSKGKGEKGGGISFLTFFFVRIIFEIAFMILGSIIVSYFSRKREFRADDGAAKIAGADKMISALKVLKQNVQIEKKKSHKGQEAFQSLQISNPKKALMLFATHPPLENRINKLKQKYK
ncbi:MAG: protease HtpX [Candidatus Muiribacteriota bacterium]